MDFFQGNDIRNAKEPENSNLSFLNFSKIFYSDAKKDHLVNNKEWFFYVKKINNCLLLKIIYICKELKQCRDDIERKKSIKELSA